MTLSHGPTDPSEVLRYLVTHTHTHTHTNRCLIILIVLQLTESRYPIRIQIQIQTRTRLELDSLGGNLALIDELKYARWICVPQTQCSSWSACLSHCAKRENYNNATTVAKIVTISLVQLTKCAVHCARPISHVNTVTQHEYEYIYTYIYHTYIVYLPI